MFLVYFLQVVLFFETVQDDSEIIDNTTNNGCPGSVSHSRTIETLHPNQNSRTQQFPGRYAETHRYKNISGVSVPSINPGKNADSVSDSYARLNLSGKSQQSGGSNTMNENVDGRRQQMPPTSQSVPNFTGQLKSPQAGGKRQGFVENNTLMPVPSDSSLASYDTASMNDPEDNFSDTDTDDEWEGCEITAV